MEVGLDKDGWSGVGIAFASSLNEDLAVLEEHEPSVLQVSLQSYSTLHANFSQ